MVKKKQQTEKKKTVIRNWFGLTLLAILIFLALIFQAHWKLITLLLITFSACIIMPKPYKKWYGLSVAAIVLALIIWVFLPDDTEGWRPYTFDEEFAALQAKYTIPDSENAATIYKNILEDYDPNTMHPDFLEPNLENLTRREPWSSRDYPELAQWLKDQQNTIAKLSEASKVARCAFTIPKHAFTDPMDHLSAMRQWAFLLIRAGNNDMAEGRIGEGLEEYLAVRKMGDHVRQQSTLVEMLVGIAIEAHAIGRFKTFVVTADVTEEHLTIIEKAVADIKYDWASDIPRLLEHEKLMAKNLICGMAYQVNSEGKTRLSRDPQAAMRPLFPGELPPLTYEQRKCIKACIVWGWFFVPSTPQKAGEIIDGIYEEFYSMVQPDFDWEKKPPEFSLSSIKFNFGFFAKSMVSLLKGSLYRIHDIYLRADAEKKGTLLIIALRRYKNKTGQWPEKLDDIKAIAPAEIFVDPFNNGSFVYKLTEENFALYSKGKNNIDEGGKRDKESGTDDWLIWPPKTRKTKNEKADAQQSNTQKDVVK